MDSEIDASFILHKHNNEKLRFYEYKNGLYLHDTKSANNKDKGRYILHEPDHFKNALCNTMTTVTQNESLFTARQVSDAKLALRLYEMVGRPSQATFARMIQQNLLRNCPIGIEDAKRALRIYGPEVNALRGKTVRTTPKRAPGFEVIAEIPQDILSLHKEVTLCIDFFFVDGITFLTTISRNIRFITVEFMHDRIIQKSVVPSITRVVNLYKARGFQVKMIMADDEFKSMKNSVMNEHGILLNTTSANEHVPEIERTVRVIKERNRASVSGLPYTAYPKELKRALIVNAVTWINMFPHADGLSNVISPRTIVTGLTADYAIHCRVPIGSYCEIHDNPRVTNTEIPRTSPAIALNPTGNTQGSVSFLSLNTGRVVTRRTWNELPITEDIIDAVNNMGIEENDVDGHEFIFELEQNQQLEPEPDQENAIIVVDNGNNPTYENDPPDIEDEDADVVIEEDIESEEEQVQAELNDNDYAESEDNDLSAAESIQDTDSDIEGEQPANTKYNLRGNRIDYSYRYDHCSVQILEAPNPSPNHHQQAVDMTNHGMAKGTQLTQYGVKAGVKLYGEAAVTAIMAECSQLDNKDAIQPVMRDTLSSEQLRRVLRAITMIKQKRCGRMKGRTVADGSKQRDYTDKNEASASTLAIESLLISICIDAKEERWVATCDIEGAYLNALMKKIIYMVYEGAMVDYLVSVNPTKYTPFIHYTSSGKKQLFVRLNKALYGCVESAQLWYQELCNTLVNKMKFVINPYDPCVANKTINGQQCTICWYVDDLKISHVSKEVVEEVIKEIEEVYGKMTVNIGQEHTYVGMDISYPGNGEAVIRMKDHVLEAIADFPECCNINVTSPAPNYLFQVTPDLPTISEPDRKIFHKIVAKLLYVANRARPDIMVAISFLTSRVLNTTDED